MASITVAPRVGAWIEIDITNDDALKDRSLPVWERGLKSKSIIISQMGHTVAPRVGAWIEI